MTNALVGAEVERIKAERDRIERKKAEQAERELTDQAEIIVAARAAVESGKQLLAELMAEAADASAASQAANDELKKAEADASGVARDNLSGNALDPMLAIERDTALYRARRIVALRRGASEQVGYAITHARDELKKAETWLASLL